ncbi:DHH family phosphoesterase [Archaeoglobus neptunius]|uniref:DHH family phosphoesterase n=1 Tax=Archaeoglobus neptunius TaxID=2798580 RepID=UPI00192915B4|nr:DHH family phosphoesterase [Archaeoglobus neptunius]
MAENGKYEYIIIGCEAAGVGLVRELTAAGKSVLAVDTSKEKIELLEDEGFDAIIADPVDVSLYKSLDFEKLSAILITGSDDSRNLEIVRAIRKISKEAYIIVRAGSQKLKDEFEDAGANLIILVSDAIKLTFLEKIKKMETYKRLEKLKRILESLKGKKLGIFTHDNPDPDSMSSAYALREIAKHFEVNADILYYGEILHQKNRAMVNILEIPMTRADEIDLNEYDAFAIVDSSGPGVNNSIPPHLDIAIVIDHHPAEKVVAEFIDLRDDVGSTATIMTEYIKELKIVPSKILATALFFGIKSETDEFKRNTRTADFLASAFLYPFVDHELIEKIEGPAISTETLDILGTAIKNRQVYSSFLLSFAGFINDRDALPQAADFLLRLEGISTVVVFGVVKDTVYISARNKDVRLHMGEVLRRAFGDVGSAGGHAHAAGAQIPLGIFGETSEKELLAKLITGAIKKRLLGAIGIEVQS